MKPLVGMMYKVCIADDPAVYRAMWVANPDNDMEVAWLVYDDEVGHRLAPLRYVRVVSIDTDHAEQLVSRVLLAAQDAVQDRTTETLIRSLGREVSDE